MNVKELKDFRAKLKYAKFLCALDCYNAHIIFAFIETGLMYECANAFNCGVPPDVYNWYTHPTRTPAEREAMWNNSIAAIDARIAKSK